MTWINKMPICRELGHKGSEAVVCPLGNIRMKERNEDCSIRGHRGGIRHQALSPRPQSTQGTGLQMGGWRSVSSTRYSHAKHSPSSPQSWQRSDFIFFPR